MQQHPIDKTIVLDAAKDHIAETQQVIAREITTTEAAIQRIAHSKDDYDETARNKILEHFSNRVQQLHQLHPSPYFVRCDVVSETGELKPYYFAKFPLIDQSVFSWMSPAARLRFSDIGKTTYKLVDGTVVNNELKRKDQLMIVHGKIVFMTSESESYGRTLVYQEKLSQRKAGFMLPEIVERMERAQDDVIRAPSNGSFLIAGPAGSGKTTLAFHRIAYLMQSPDTAATFSSVPVIVFVQDEGTKAYFSKLLPDLGIHDVNVTTFGEWALDRLAIHNATVIRRPNGVDDEIDGYERRKCAALRSEIVLEKKSKDPFKVLEMVYASVFLDSDNKRFRQQVLNRELDRFDLTILLELDRRANGAFQRQQEYLIQKKNFEVIRKTRSVPLVYSLVVVDEAQNYLPEQVTLLRSCVASETKAILYVGDLGQQVLLGTTRDWSHAGEVFAKDQKVQLEKVYRNTKMILAYLSTLGFNTMVPEGLREGEAVLDIVCNTVEEEIKRIQELIEAQDAQTQIGILSPSEQYLSPFKDVFATNKNVHILTIHESQGVEFDHVCLVGVSENFFEKAIGDSEAEQEERLRIKRDLVYVGLTRAMEGLSIFGRKTLLEVFKSI